MRMSCWRCGMRLGAAFAASLAAVGCRSSDLPQEPEPRLEPGRAGAFQSGGKPARSGAALRLHGDLHHAAVGPGQGPACAARPGLARIRRGGEPGRAAFAARAGAACRGTLRLAQGHGRCRGDLSSAALESPAEAARLLSSVPDLESAGVVVRMPASWRANRPARPQVTATVGARPPSRHRSRRSARFPHGRDAGRRAAHRRGNRHAARRHRHAGAAARSMGGDRSPRVLNARCGSSEEAQALAEQDGLTFAEAMRLLAGAAVTGTDQDTGVADWSQRDGRPLAGRDAEGVARSGWRRRRSRPGPEGNLAPLSEGGRAMDASAVRAWPGRLPRRRHGARQDDPGSVAAAGPSGGAGRAMQPSLLVAPASLLANWAAEIERFAPGLTAKIVHPSAMTADQVRQVTPDQLSGIDLAITSYGTLLRMPVLAEMRLALCRSGRGAGDQEPERQADQGGQGPQGQGTHRADRNAGRKPPGRSVVDLRFHQSRSARNRQAIHQLHQEGWPSARTTPTARCVNWCAPTSCGG